MLKKILCIALAFAMLVTFTGCDLLEDVTGAISKMLGLGGGTKQEAVAGTPDGGIFFEGEDGDGSIRIEIETDEEGNMIGKIEKVEEDEADKKGYTTMNACDYVGLTVNELKQIAGDDVTYTDDWLYGASRGVYYADGRISATFYFTDDQYRDPSEYTGGETINLVFVAGNTLRINDELDGTETFHDILDRGEYALYENMELGGNSTTLQFGIHRITYTWLTNDPYQGPADLIEIMIAY